MNTKFKPVTLVLYASQPIPNQACACLEKCNCNLAHGPMQEFGRRTVTSKASYNEALEKARYALLQRSNIILYEQQGLVLVPIVLNIPKKDVPKFTNTEEKTFAVKEDQEVTASETLDDNIKTQEDLPTFNPELEETQEKKPRKPKAEKSEGEAFVAPVNIDPEDPFASLREALNQPGQLFLPPTFKS